MQTVSINDLLFYNSLSNKYLNENGSVTHIDTQSKNTHRHVHLLYHPLVRTMFNITEKLSQRGSVVVCVYVSGLKEPLEDLWLLRT